MAIPPWLEVMRAITGLTEYENGSNPKIEAMAEYIGHKFPEQATYASQYTSDDIAWCGVTAAFCMAVCDIEGPFGPTDTDKWMWALSWSEDDGYQPLTQPVPGCWVAMERSGGGHITCFEEWDGGMLRCRGGNQSNAVNVSSYDPDTVVAYVWPKGVPIPPPDPADRRNLEEGDRGTDVAAVQQTLGVHPEDGDFGSITDSAVKGYQAACSITVDGEVGPMTWEKLDELDAKVASGSENLSPELIGAIVDVAENSSIASYSWMDRGRAPLGYTAGVALCFASALVRLNTEDDAAFAMAEPNTNDEDKDVFAWYSDEFDDEGMDNSERADPADRLRHLFAFMLGLGLRESSGRYCEGRDQSASNTSSDEAEAGMYQTSWNIRSCHSTIPPLLTEYWKNPCGFRDVFQNGVSLNSDDLGNYGSGPGAQYQFLSKYAPCFHAFVTAIGLRNLRAHWGPVNRYEVELKGEADAMLQAVQALVEEGDNPSPEPEPDVAIANITAVGSVNVLVNGEPAWSGEVGEPRLVVQTEGNVTIIVNNEPIL